MRHITLFAVLFTVLVSACGAMTPPYRFEPNWKVGEQKTLTITVDATNMKINASLNGSDSTKTTNGPNGPETTTSLKDSTTVLNGSLEVISKSRDAYRVDLKADNMIMLIGSKYYEIMPHALPNDVSITLQFLIRRDSCISKLTNLSQLQSGLRESGNRVLEILRKEVPNRYEEAQKEIGEWMINESAAEKLEMYNIFPYLLPIYQKDWIPGDTLISRDATINPYGLKDYKGSEMKSFLSGMDEKNKTVEITSVKEFGDISNVLINNLSSGLKSTTSTMDGLFSSMTGTTKHSETTIIDTVRVSPKINPKPATTSIQQSVMNLGDMFDDSDGGSNTNLFGSFFSSFMENMLKMLQFSARDRIVTTIKAGESWPTVIEHTSELTFGQLTSTPQTMNKHHIEIK